MGTANGYSAHNGYGYARYGHELLAAMERQWQWQWQLAGIELEERLQWQVWSELQRRTLLSRTIQAESLLPMRSEQFPRNSKACVVHVMPCLQTAVPMML